MKKKASKEKTGNFVFSLRMGEYEVELDGSREEVFKTIEDLPRLIANVHRAFETVKPKTVATLTVKTEPPKEEPRTQKYPRISPTENCDEAILRILETDWGKWRPRIIGEIKEALKTNGMNYSGRILSGTLNGLVKKGKIRRWNTNAGFVYILAEEEALDKKETTE